MASASPLKDIDEQFLQCSICLSQLVEPKMLPCLHHFCRNCLHGTFQKNQKKAAKEQTTKVECPTCREKHDLPEKGVDGFKTDFNIKNIIEFIQLQDSVKHEPLKICIHCTKKLKVTGYCFKCNDFLCEKCHEHHMTNMIVKDHRPHVLSLGDVEARNLTVEKLSSLRESPRCHKHPGKPSELCCSTCGNLPICVACSYGAHRGHDLQEVSTLAETERAKLSRKMGHLMEYKGKICEMPERLKLVVESLSHCVKEKERELQEEYNQRGNDIKTEIRRSVANFEKEKKRIEQILNGKLVTRKRELEQEMRTAQERYDKACEEDRRETGKELEKLQEQHDKENAGLQEKLGGMNKQFRQLMTSLRDQQQKQAEEIKQMLDGFDDIMKRFENVTKIASSIIAAKNDWTDVQCIPDVCAAIDPLQEVVAKDLPEPETLTGVAVRGLPAVVKNKVDITEREETVLDIEGLGVGSGWRINDITGTDDGRLVVTGVRNDKKQSFISVIDLEGRQIRKNLIDSHRAFRRYCDSLQQSKIVTGCYPNEIGIYDARDGEYISKNVDQITNKSLPGWYIFCLAVNPASNHIILGRDSTRVVHVFDMKMEYVKNLNLPKMANNPRDITVHGDNLLVCEYGRNRAYAVTMKGSECELVYEFPKPNVKGVGCQQPLSVCTDSNNFIYMFWQGSPNNILAQYSQDGSRLLATRLVDMGHYSECITTVPTDLGEKLLIATEQTGKLITYGLS